MLALLIAALAAPVPGAPADDPDFAHCLAPRSGVQLQWDPAEEGAATWLVVKRRDEGGEWQTWVRSYVQRPPFTLSMRTRIARNGDFAWIVFGVAQEAGEFVAGDWRYFCTRD